MAETIVPLDALLRRASRIAENMFDEHAEVDMFWLVENAAGEQQMIASPVAVPPGVSGPEYKQALAESMREFFREHGIVRYARACECWTVKDEAYQGPVAQHPQRREIVFIDADDGCKYLGAMREIIRPPQGKPYLGKLGAIEQGEPGGRFTNLFAVRPSSELADDEGTVFVTHVPGADIQIIGRRGPTGELFVSQVGYVSGPFDEQGLREDAAAHGVDIEIVTGPEAERLIARVQQKLSSDSTKH
jgi:hypothetical protein